MRVFENTGYWAIILGASSGMGLACAKKLSAAGMNLVLLHRDRKGRLQEVEEEFESFRRNNVAVVSYNIDALNEEKRKDIIGDLSGRDVKGKFRLLVHSISKGNLKLMKQAEKVLPDDISDEISKKFAETQSIIENIEYPKANLEEIDFTLTTQAMATSMLSWTRDLLDNGLFSKKARVIGLTSEGDVRVWKGYGAVAAAKATLDVISKYMAVELAHTGLTTNIIQAGITETPSLNMIPGSDVMMASAKFRNPMKRLTTPEDIANVIYLLAQDEADWINGSRIIVDGGEHLV